MTPTPFLSKFDSGGAGRGSESDDFSKGAFLKDDGLLSLFDTFEKNAETMAYPPVFGSLTDHDMRYSPGG